MPAERPVIVFVDSLPVLVMVPVLPVPVRIQSPGDGKPLKATDPVADEQVGWVIAPTIGGAGVALTDVAITLEAAVSEVKQAAPVTVISQLILSLLCSSSDQ